MAFETTVLRNGRWVVETVSLQDALNAYEDPRAKDISTLQAAPESSCGILTRTVAQSPMVKQILPVRIRTKHLNDIAFIGEESVQILELQENGRTQEIARKQDFGSPICNAAVLGSRSDDGLDVDDMIIDTHIKTEASEVFDADVSEPTPAKERANKLLPPQILVLVLANSDLVFLFMKQNMDRRFEFCMHKNKGPPGLSGVGYHLAVNQNSRYLVTASLDKLLVIYELHPLRTHEEAFSPIKHIWVQAIPGCILRLVFLYPEHNDDQHNILLLITAPWAKRSKTPLTKMLTFEWRYGDDIGPILSKDQKGHRLPMGYNIPTLLIPLRFQSSYLSISESFVGLVRNILSGSPDFETLPIAAPGPTSLHYGSWEPMWTAWARPFRRQSYLEKFDIIYLAREDGVMIHVELDADHLGPSITNIGRLDTRVDTAFTTAYDVFSDLLIIGGDSGPGGIWKLPARSDPSQLSPIPNWAPVVDVTSTHDHASWTESSSASADKVDNQAMKKPDRVFMATGCGSKGSVVEYRRGLRARVGLDLDLGEPIRQAWIFPEDPLKNDRLFAILALPYSTVVLPLPAGEDDVEITPATTTHFECVSRTLCIVRVGENIIAQITEQSITLIAPSQRSHHEISRLLDSETKTIDQTCCAGNVIVVSTQEAGGSKLYALNVEQLDISCGSSWSVAEPVHCMMVFRASKQYFIAIGTSNDASPAIAVYTLEGKLSASQTLSISGEAPMTTSSLETLTSICNIQEGDDGAILAAGTRCGRLITIKISNFGDAAITWTVERLGTTQVDLYPAPHMGNLAVFACCDDHLILLSNLSPEGRILRDKDIVWTTDSADASALPPPIHSAFSLRHDRLSPAGASLLLVAGTRLLLTDIDTTSAPVPRTFALGGTPTRMIFSQAWKCLVMAVQQNDRPTLLFIDPDTGNVISTPKDRKSEKTEEFASGFGHAGDKIYGLYEWLYMKDGKQFPFIVATTMKGSLLIVSVRREKEPQGSASLSYWTRYRKLLPEPVYAVVADKERLIYCSGHTLCVDEISELDKKLKQVKLYMLDSPATSLSMTHGYILALTQSHSLEVIDHRTNPESAEMTLVHNDEVSRATMHMIEMSHSTDSDLWPWVLVSDANGGVFGMRIPWGKHNQEIKMAFSGELSTCVRRFVRARCRPTWLVETQSERRFGSLRSTPVGGEILGVSIDGTVRHFALLKQELTEFLLYIQGLGLQDPVLNPLHGDQSGTDVTTRHVDGDLLMRCLRQNKSSEFILRTTDRTETYCGLLDKLGDGVYTRDFRQSSGLDEQTVDKYIRLGNEILEYLMAPII